jgi:23S rRNA (adenine2503-C2)-methyltransferase
LFKDSVVFLLDQFPEEWALPEGPAYRRRQISDWALHRRARSFAEMTNLPAPYRDALTTGYDLLPLQLEKVQGAQDQTQKFLWKLAQGDFIESVLIPANVNLFGERSTRRTLCVSSQVGCAYGCKFCASGLDGWKRHLSPAEIVAQITEAEHHSKGRLQNLVFMGMGEPLANYENLLRALTILNADWGLHIGARHITISTSGLVPQIYSLAEQPRQFRLAISLHGASDEVRSQIMPVNRKYPLAELIPACEAYTAAKGQMITFEFILIAGINDSLDQARLLGQLARRTHAKVNLIPYNTVEGLPWQRPDEKTVRAFAEHLRKGGVTATLRHEKGHDIDAACGQLRLRQLRSLEPLRSPAAPSAGVSILSV